MGPWKKFESTVVRLKRSYENTGNVVCITTKGRQLKQKLEELKPANYRFIISALGFGGIFGREKFSFTLY
jgi:hypothetical protein